MVLPTRTTWSIHAFSSQEIMWLCIGAPITTTSAARSSSINSSETERYWRCSGVSLAGSPYVASQSSVIWGSTVLERSRSTTSPRGCSAFHSWTNLEVNRHDSELARALESMRSSFIKPPILSERPPCLSCQHSALVVYSCQLVIINNYLIL